MSSFWSRKSSKIKTFIFEASVHTLKGFYSNYHQNKSREQLKINLTDFSKLTNRKH